MKRGLLWALLVASGFFALSCFDAIVEPDIGFHVAVGRLILRSGIPHTNALSWVASGHPWFPNSWLYDAVSATVADRLGPLGLQLLTFAFGVSALALLARLLGPRGVLLLPAIALMLLPRLEPRPHVVTWVALAGTLLLCLEGRDRPLLRWASIPLIAVAVNWHVGAAFAAGVAGIFFLEAFLRTRRWQELAGGAMAGVALLVTPGRFLVLADLFGHLHTSRYLPVAEFAPPSWRVLLGVGLFGLTALAVAAGRVRQDPALLACTAVFAGLMLFAGRMEAELLVVATPSLGEGVRIAAQRLGPRIPALCAAGAVLFAVLMTNFGERVAILDPGPKFDASVLPVRAARYIASEGLDGPHFNSFDDGGYLAYALPSLPVFLDGRIIAYPEELYARLIEAQRSPARFDRFLRDAGITWAVTQRRDTATTGNGLLERLPGWALVYWDDINEVFVRRDVPRWAVLIARDEFHALRPDGAGQGSRAETESEAERLRQAGVQLSR